jgi:hypothetical protein
VSGWQFAASVPTSLFPVRLGLESHVHATWVSVEGPNVFDWNIPYC